MASENPSQNFKKLDDAYMLNRLKKLARPFEASRLNRVRANPIAGIARKTLREEPINKDEFELLCRTASKIGSWHWQEKSAACCVLGIAPWNDQQKAIAEKSLAAALSQQEHDLKSRTCDFASRSSRVIGTTTAWVLTAVILIFLVQFANTPKEPKHAYSCGFFMLVLALPMILMIMATPVVALVAVKGQSDASNAIRIEAALALSRIGSARNVPLLLRSSSNAKIYKGGIRAALMQLLPGIEETPRHEHGTTASAQLALLAASECENPVADTAEELMIFLTALGKIGDARLLPRMQYIKNHCERIKPPHLKLTETAGAAISEIQKRAETDDTRLTLLRACKEPVGDQELLRASNRRKDDDADQLLRSET